MTIIFNVIQYKAPQLDEYFFPGWAQVLGWLIALWPILTIPAWFLLEYCARGGYVVSTNTATFAETGVSAKSLDVASGCKIVSVRNLAAIGLDLR